MSRLRASLALGLGRDLVFAVLACAAVLLVSLSMQLTATKRELRERSLEAATRYIERNLTAEPVGQVSLPSSPGSSWASFGYPTIVFDRDGEVVFQRPAEIDPALAAALFEQHQVATGEGRRTGGAVRFFTLRIGESRIIGAALRTRAGADERIIKVFKDEGAPDVLIDDVVNEFPYRSVRVLLPIFAGLLLVSGFVVWRRMRPIAKVAAIAETIGPQTLDVRLPEDRLPGEILPIVRSVNGAFERLERAAAAQREFLRRAAHHLRTPLTVLSARAASLDDTEASRRLRADVDELARITSQLLQLNEIETMADRAGIVADLGAVGEAVRDELAGRAARRGMRITLAAPDMPVLVCGDPNVIEVAIRNLVDNALDHSPDGSAVGIRVEADGRIEVGDAGPGIPKDLRGKIFEPFWSGDPHGARAGLGLTIVTRVVERYRGSVAIGTAPGGGATVALQFPIAPEAARGLDPNMVASGVPASLAHRRRQRALEGAAG